AIGTPPELYQEQTDSHYKYSPARFNGNNYYPVDKYDPKAPRRYGDGVGLMPNENVIHTAAGYYNPTLDVSTGRWATFMFENFSLNSTHIIQLIRRDTNGALSVEGVTVVGTDGDMAQWASPTKSTSKQLPILMPGGRLAVQHAFSKPGQYYFISNATREVLGEDAPVLSNIPVGNGTAYLGYNDGFQITPSQVLATVRVRGEEILTPPDQPVAWDALHKQYEKSNRIREQVRRVGVDRERTYQWLTKAPTGSEFNDPSTWENTWVINGQYWTHSPLKQPTLTTVMLDTIERWKIQNLSSGRKTTSLDGSQTYNVAGQSHPFHLHTNEFLVESINGFKVSDDPSLNQVGDSLYSTFMDSLLLTPRFKPGTASPINPYGLPGSVASTNATPSTDTPFEAEILIEFADYPGLFVDHCHLLFHEDGGMMAPVQTILNTDSSWLSSTVGHRSQSVQLSLASAINSARRFTPYKPFEQSGNGIVVASGDINANRSVFTPGKNGNTVNVTDNIADIATIQQRASENGDFMVKVFDGRRLQREWQRDNGEAGKPVTRALHEFKPFDGKKVSRKARADLAVGDVNGDGYSDIAVTVGGKSQQAVLEVYSGKDLSLMASFNPFGREVSSTALSVAIGDIDADNFADIIIGEGEGGSGTVMAYSGLEIYKNSLLSSQDQITGSRLAGVSSMIKGGFYPFGCDYKGAVDIAATYILPRGFAPDQITQSVYANITTLAVNKQDAPEDPALRNFLFLGHLHGHAGQFRGKEDLRGCCHVSDKHHGKQRIDKKCCEQGDKTQAGHGNHHTLEEVQTDKTPHLPASVAYTSSIRINSTAKEIQTQYLDLNTAQRGEATLLVSLTNGSQAILHLGEDSYASGPWKELSPEVTAWMPNVLA
ncbi:MAG: multicopper oxidase domain-containing protein, partial [Actinomycetota bacterium]